MVVMTIGYRWRRGGTLSPMGLHVPHTRVYEAPRYIVPTNRSDLGVIVYMKARRPQKAIRQLWVMRRECLVHILSDLNVALLQFRLGAYRHGLYISYILEEGDHQ